MRVKLMTPIVREDVMKLHAGDSVDISGIIYTARDAAHARIFEAMDARDTLPMSIVGQAIYYCGPAPTPPGKAIGSAGPTTSYRMDAFAPKLYSLGLAMTIGKGDRGIGVREACKRYGGIYLVTPGGAGALLSERVKETTVIAYPELGPEALRKLVVEDFPAIVAYDAFGASVFPGDEPL